MKEAGHTNKVTKTRTVLPPFLKKLRIITETCPPDIAGWAEDGLSYEIYSPRFEEVLSLYFKGTLSTFIRQLHFYGCNKKEKDGCEFVFVHKYLQRDHPELIERIKRKTRGDAVEGFASTEDVKQVGTTVNELEVSIMEIRAKLIRASKKLGVDFAPKVTQLRPDSPPTENANNNKSNSTRASVNNRGSAHHPANNRGNSAGMSANKPHSTVTSAVANRNAETENGASQVDSNINTNNHNKKNSNSNYHHNSSNNNNNNNYSRQGTSPVVAGSGVHRTNTAPLPARTLQTPPVNQTGVPRTVVRVNEAPLVMGKPVKSMPVESAIRAPAATVHKFMEKPASDKLKENELQGKKISTVIHKNSNTTSNMNHDSTRATTDINGDRVVEISRIGEVHNTASHGTDPSISVNDVPRVQQIDRVGASTGTGTAKTTSVSVAKTITRGPKTINNHAAAASGTISTTHSGGNEISKTLGSSDGGNDIPKTFGSRDGVGNGSIGNNDIPETSFGSSSEDSIFGEAQIGLGLRRGVSDGSVAAAVRLGLGIDGDVDIDGDESMMQFLDSEALNHNLDVIDFETN